MSETENLTISFTAADRESMERELEAALSVAKAKAMSRGTQGILVTRHTADRFTVALTDAVPFGYTREYQTW